MKTFMSLLLCAALASCGAVDLPEGVEPYPLDFCLVMDSELGSMGDEVSLIYQGREVKFCCEPCIDEFNADPAKFMAKLDAAIADRKK